jgi:2-deoxy-D-gluconate 3-dehydrogenase
MKSLHELLDLKGKAAIVTGAAKGIGQAVAYRLAEAGASVVIADTDEAAAIKTAAQLNDKGQPAVAIKADVADEKDVKRMIGECTSVFGGVDILVNNAGIYPSSTIERMTPAEFDRVLQVNLRGVFLTTKYAAEAMKERGGGSIVNVTSIDALRPSMAGLAHYDASKHGAWGFTKNAALELASHNIRVNAVAPGGIATPGVAAMNRGGTVQSANAAKAFLGRIPMGRMGQPDEIGTAVLYLVSDMATYVTGSQLVVDGGALLK